MLMPMPGDQRYTVDYEVLGVAKRTTVTLSIGMQAYAETNIRIMVRSSTKFRTAKEYNSFKIIGFAPIPQS